MSTHSVDPDQPDEVPAFDGWGEDSPGPPPPFPPYGGMDPYPSPSALFHPRSGASLRAFLALALVASTIVIVLLGIILRIPPNEMVQYLAPITPLAGAAVGYWYGAER